MMRAVCEIYVKHDNGLTWVSMSRGERTNEDKKMRKKSIRQNHE